ncbi:hypothetical protein QVD17_40603 [Tagetes erecta]|uniref:Uncharacterized protein n=1 Tax=Tagetes erecta TaxID=13708 RepID=A0AAD8JTY7_TARER|nr:hypothetical protein QVD17_40603 [Tagetes erecta]
MVQHGNASWDVVSQAVVEVGESVEASIKIQRLKGKIEGLVTDREMEKVKKEREKAKKRKVKNREREGTTEKKKTEKENMLERMMKMEATLECLSKQLPQVNY